MPGPEPCEPEIAAAKTERPKTILPWRGKAQARDAELDARTRSLLDAIEAERQAKLARESAPPAVAKPPKTEAKKQEPSPLVAGLCILAAVVAGFIVYFAAASKN
jgi:hypothetical protein